MGSHVESDAYCARPGVTRDALPVHRVYVDAFWMDATELTNEEFGRFEQATGYVTIAERTPTAAEFPGAPPENLVAGSTVFTPAAAAIPLDNHYRWWRYQKGADWRHPEGPGSTIDGRGKHPVVQIAFDDALAYAKWAGKRLPTEAEWEFEARGGMSGKLYAWGDEFRPGPRPTANTFQGRFPVKDTGADGFAGVAPVASYAPNGYGLDAPYDPAEPGDRKRVQRGGSFLCTDEYCTRYMVGTRGRGEVSTASNHVGVRLARDASYP